jgi:hypothetical protein
MPRSRRNRGAGIDIWPGFVDALTQLTMVIVFVLLIFTLAQFYLSGAVSNRDAAIVKLTAQINELSAALGLEKTSKSALEKQVATLNAEGEKAKADITEREHGRVEAAARRSLERPRSGSGQGQGPGVDHRRPHQEAQSGARQQGRGARPLSLGILR